MKRNLKLFGGSLFFLCSLFGLANCEIGLGPQVDTDTPVISITSPDIGTSQKQTFIVEGTCGDDNGVKTIKVTLRDSNGKSHDVGTLNSSDLTAEGRAWSIEVDTSNYGDATYEIVAEAFDASKRHSTATRSINIDNTPPVVLMSKPNSLLTTNVDTGVFGQTVTLAGEILDDHEITALYIRAFDENGTELTLSGEKVKINPDDENEEAKWQKWTDFDVQGGVSLTIAQYLPESEIATATEKEKLLAENYKAFFTGSTSGTIDPTSAAFMQTKVCQLVVVATDESGNQSKCSYIKSDLNKVVSEKTGIPVTALRSTKYKTIANGTCPVDDVFTTARQAIIRNILENIGDYDISYASSEEGNKLTFSICPENSPTYDISGFTLENGAFTPVGSAGTLPLIVTYGLDKFNIEPDSLDVTLWKCDDSGNYNASDSSNILFTTKGATMPTEDSTELEELQWKSIYWSDNDEDHYTKESSATTDGKTYTIQLPVLKSSQKVRVIVEGQDEAGNKLIPQNGAIYAFKVSSSETAPRISASDQEYYSKTQFTNGVDFVIDISDNSGDFDEHGKVSITPTVYEGHLLKTNYESSTGNKTTGTKATYNMSSGKIEKLSDTSYRATIPLTPTLGNEDNYTVVYEVTVTNSETDNPTRQVTNFYVFWADCKGPEIELSNPWTEDNGSTVTTNEIDETSAYWNVMTYAQAKEQDGVTDIISLNSLDEYITDETLVNVYSIRGYWSDVSGAGTKALYFQIADDASSLNTDTSLNSEYMPTNTKWMQIDTMNTTAGATSRFAITNAQIVREGTGTAIAFFAVDNVGNVSKVYKYSKLVFDFGAPKLTIPSPEHYYNASSAEDIVFTLSAEDSNALAASNAITVTAKKNGSTVSSGSDGYTFALGSQKKRTGESSGIELAAKLFDASLSASQDATVTLKRNTNATDGKWTFTVTAKDINERTCAEQTFSTIVDTTAPLANGKINIGEEEHDNDASWYKNGTLRVEGKYTEATSGLQTVYYVVKSSEATSATVTQIDAAVSNGDIRNLSAAGKVLLNTEGSNLPTEYTITPTGFKAGENTLYIQAIDNAGNISGVSSYTIRLDETSPNLSAAYYTFDGIRYEDATGTVYANKKDSLVIYGSVSDANSGVAEFENVIIGGLTANADFTYSTEELPADPASVASVTFEAYDVANAKDIKSFRAEISKEQLIKGAVKLTAKDVAANTLPQTFFTLSIDEVAPDAVLSSPASGSVLNGTVDFTGTSSDGTAVRSVKLYYSYSSSAEEILDQDTLVGELTDSNSYNWEFNSQKMTYYDGETIKLYGNTTYEGRPKDIWFKLLVEDVARNTTIKVWSFTIDPETDRPSISLSNLASDGTSLLKEPCEVYGSISDDDGIKALWIIESETAPSSYPTIVNGEPTSDNDWTRITVSNGGFTQKASDDDGSKFWWFYCLDSAGGTFTTAFNSGSYAQLRRPLISFTDEANKDVTSAIKFAVDKKAPEIKKFKISQALTGTTKTAEEYAEDSEVDWKESNGIVFGGNKNVLYLQIDVFEETGMSDTPFEMTVSKVAQNLTEKLYSSYNSATHIYTYTVGPFTLDTASYGADGTKSIAVTVRDKAGTSAQQSKNVVLDTKAPTVKFEYPLPDDRISTTIDVMGSVDDGADGIGVESIKWIIPTKTEAEGITADSTDWNNLESSSTINISFDSLEKTSTRCILYYANETYANEQASDDPEVHTGLWDIPIYFLVTDKLGNSTIDDTNKIIGDTLSGLPTADIIYPTNGNVIDGVDTPVGGTLTIYGSATDDIEVTLVQVQLDVNGDDTFSKLDYDVLYSWRDDNGLVNGFELVAPTSEAANDWYLKPNGLSSWNITVETKKVSYAGHTGLDGEPNPKMGIRTRAFDAQENTRGWTTTQNLVYVTIDKKVPVIGTLYVNGYKDGVLTINREYKDGMYISGFGGSVEWYLEGNLTDDVGVENVEFAEIGNYIRVDNTAVQLSYADPYADPIDKTQATLKAKLNTSADGQIYTNLIVYDNDKNTSQNIRINIDSTAPSLYRTNGNETSGTGVTDLRLVHSAQNISESNFMQNSSGIYSFGDDVLETGSGLEYIAFYFMRKAQDGSSWRTYNPLEETGNVGNRTDTATDYVLNDDGLAVKKVSGSRPDTGSFTSSTAVDSTNVHKGTLIKIGGTYCKVTSVSGNTVTFTPNVNTSFTTAEFVYAQVVDHLATEGPTNGDYKVIKNDDYDGLVETLKNDSGKYTWTASIDSLNIPDGPIEIHVVAIDNAGNISSGICSSNVYNNPPRLAKILLGTELNGNGVYDFSASEEITNDTKAGRRFGEFVYYSALNDEKKTQEKASISVEEKDWFTVKDGLLLVPEFVGGNTSIIATYKVSDTEITLGDPYKTDASGITSYGSLYSKADTLTLAPDAEDYISDFGSFYMTNSGLTSYESKKTTNGTTTTKAKYFGITFWDETEEKTQGKDSQYTMLSFPVVIDQIDDIKPLAEIEPFYWNDYSDNSVYKDGDANLKGHIELEGDLPETFTSTSGAKDKDPKVSGIIRLTGTASDETMLKELKFSFDGIQINNQTAGSGTTLATFVNGEWTFANKTTCALEYTDTDGEGNEVVKYKTKLSGDSDYEELDASPLSSVETVGWSLVIRDEKGVTQDGHSITWELNIDTQKLSGYAGLDKSFKVYASDTSSSGNEINEAYQMDVVPYVTKVITALSSVNASKPSVFNRTALGHYPVYITYAGDLENNYNSATYETIALEGYNLTGASVTAEKVTQTWANNVSNNVDLDGNLKFVLPKGAKSGYLTITVSDVEAANNINNNDAHGSYDYTVQGYTQDDIGVTGNKDIYDNYYNRQPNGVNNNNLTDDIYIDVWQFNTKAAVPYNNSALDVMMKVNPSSGMIDFAFCGGDRTFAMAQGTTNSYIQWATSADFVQCTGFAVDKNGVAYATALGGESGDTYGDCYNFYVSKWGTSDDTGGGKNALRIGSIAQGASKADFVNLAKNRYVSPSVATDGTYAYLAYYDLLSKELRFQGGGTIPNNKEAIGTLIDSYTNARGPGTTSIRTLDAEHGLVQVLADRYGNGLGYINYTGADTEFISIGIANSHVVLIWYDSKNTLQYTYATSTNWTPGTGVNSTGWATPIPLLTGNIKNCKLVVDSDNQIHIAAYDASRGDLKYIYLPKYNITSAADAKVCTVDSYSSVGSEITIDVAKSTSGYQIPYIGYYGTTPKKARFAYLADPKEFYTGTTQNGAVSDLYTGVWECTIVPMISTMNPSDTRHRINVGVWKNWSTGVISNSSEGTSTANNANGICYGNGTQNAVLAYSIRLKVENKYVGYVETAQKR